MKMVEDNIIVKTLKKIFIYSFLSFNILGLSIFILNNLVENEVEETLCKGESNFNESLTLVEQILGNNVKLPNDNHFIYKCNKK